MRLYGVRGLTVSADFFPPSDVNSWRGEYCLLVGFDFFTDHSVQRGRGIGGDCLVCMYLLRGCGVWGYVRGGEGIQQAQARAGHPSLHHPHTPLQSCGPGLTLINSRQQKP